VFGTPNLGEVHHTGLDEQLGVVDRRRKDNFNNEASTWSRPCAELGIMRICNCSRDAKTNSVTLAITNSLGAKTLERLKETIDFARGDHSSGVFNRERRPA